MNLTEQIDNVVKRSKAFYAATKPGYFLINAIVPAETPEIPALYDFDLDHQTSSSQGLDFS